MERTKEIEPVILPLPAQEEKNKEQATAILIGKLANHSVIIRKGTTFLIVFSILALYAAMYLMHMESVDRHLESPAYKTAVR
jgi:hypothetical protein